MSDKAKFADSNFSTGAVRSADVAHLDFCSAPLMGLLGMLRVAGGGGTKYGRFNYMLSMPQHETLNHAAVHLIRYILGDRTEPHLEKVAWGALVAAQNEVLHPETCSPHMLGPGAILTPDVLAELDRGKADRDANRQAGEFEDLFAWTLADMPEIQAILSHRESIVTGPVLATGNGDGASMEPIETAWGTISPEWGSGSTNAKVYGTPTRTEEACGRPNPGPNERWVEYGDGTRAYFIKGRGMVEVDDEGFIVIPADNPSPHGDTLHIDPAGSHPVDYEARRQARVTSKCDGTPGCKCDSCLAFDAGVRP